MMKKNDRYFEMTKNEFYISAFTATLGKLCNNFY